METWKLAVIVFLVGALGGYGAYQSQLSKPPAPPTPEQIKQAQKKQVLPVHTLMNQPVPQWKIADAANWMNTARPLSSADFKGQVTLMEFFRIDCHHCQEAAPFMKYLDEKYKAKGLKIVGLQPPVTDREKDWKGVQQQIASWGLKYPIAFDADKVFMGPFKGTNFPTMLLLDKAGIIRYIETGHDAQKSQALESKIQQLLGAGAKAPKTASPKTP